MEQHVQKDPLVHNTMTINSATQSSKRLNCTNKRGRPCQSKMISFCPQPKSIVSQLLNKIKTMRSNKNAVDSAKVNDSLPIHTILANKYFSEIQPQLINGTEVLDYNNLPDVETTSECEEFQTLNHDSNNECNDTKSWNMELLSKSKPYKSKRKNIKRKRCNNTGQLQDHLSTLEDVYFTCDYTECAYNTKIMSNLLKHKRVHTNERPYLCDQCTFRSNFVNSLKVHKRIHTTERPYCCEQCGHRCNSISNLKKHRLHKHKNASKVVK